MGVYGLENYTGNGATEILVPVPVIDGEPLFNDSVMVNSTSFTQHHSQWKPDLVATEKGKMFSFSTGEKELANAYFTLDDVRFTDLPLEDYENRSAILDSVMYAPFSPVASGINFTRPPSASIKYTATPDASGFIPGRPGRQNFSYPSEYKHNYTSYVYIDENLQPVPGRNHTIEVYSQFELNEGSYSNVGYTYVAVIREYIPEGVKGWVPIKVYVL